MATKVLGAGAVSFASPNWSGGAIANGDDLVIQYDFGAITDGALDQSGLAEGVNSVWIKDSVNSGTIGGASGPFIIDCDVDTGGGSYFANFGNVLLYYQAGGDNNLCSNFSCGRGSQNYIVGGTLTNTSVGGSARFNANGSTILTNFYADGGGGELKFNATDMTIGVFTGGNWTVRRGLDLMILGGTAKVLYDPDDSVTQTSNVIRQYGGDLSWVAGAVPTYEGYAGRLDFSRARTTFTAGATDFAVGGVKITPSPSVTYTPRYLSAAKRSELVQLG